MRGARIRAIFVCCVCASALACTDPAERNQVRILIDADSAVKSLVDDVQAVVETQNSSGGGWQSATSPRRFEPKVTGAWPLEFSLETGNAPVSYQVTATARDDHGSVVGFARAVRDWDSPSRRTIVLRFEAACARRAPPCPNGQTCHAGDCVDAHYEAPADAPAESGTDAAPGTVEDAGPDPGGPTLATEGEDCSPEGARACTEEGSRAPLHCESAMWRTAPMCAEDELCDTTPGAQRGTCRRVADECRGHPANVEFCSSDMMLVCETVFGSTVRPCGPNEHCVASKDARCECLPGFFKAPAGCERPADCTVENGGCDAMTKCTMQGSDRTCSECPPGYVGRGETGCDPLLADLTPSVGALVPAFDPAVRSYRIELPLLAQRLTLTPSADSAARIELNGSTVTPGAAWTTPTLPLGEYPVKLALTSSSGVTSDYDLIIARSGAQSAYLKASNVGEGDDFGIAVAISGDTLVVGALYEDSAAVTVDGDQSDNSLRDAGAAYVFVRRGDQWEQQAYLKASDAAAQDYFGTHVAIDGDTIAVGAIHDDISGLTGAAKRPGAGYVFTRSAGHWTQTARLAPTEGGPSDLFGYALALQGDDIAVGAPGDGSGGAAYVFRRSGSEWKEQRKLKAQPEVADAMFGSSIALSRDTLLVGSQDDSTEVSKAGSAYVYTRSDASWTLQQRLVPMPAASGASFGYSVALRGDEAIVGAPRYASILAPVPTSPGEVFLFRRSSDGWKQAQLLKATLPRSSDSFGSGLALTDTALLIGACGDSSGARGVGADASRRDALYAGAGYLYAREDRDWKLSAYLKAANAETNDSFGFGVALSGEVAVVSANWEQSKAAGVNGNQDDNSLSTPGAAYVFQ